MPHRRLAAVQRLRNLRDRHPCPHERLELFSWQPAALSASVAVHRL
jgi:hypothetical protein